MPATKFSCYQEALRLFGDARLALITDDATARYAMDDAWDGVVAFCLRAAPWRFALRTALLVETSAPLPGFEIAYSKPADWLRTHALFVLVGALERPIDIREQGVQFSSIHADVQIRFVSSFYADPSFTGNPWPEHFAKVVAAYLAFQVADRLTNSAAAGQRMGQLFGSAMAEAMLHDALPENPWLRYQLDGSFQVGMLYVLSQGYWSHALKTIDFSAPPITEPSVTMPIIGYPYSYPRPADMLRSHAFFVPAGDGREHPIDIKEDGSQWSTTANYFAVRYVSSESGTDPVLWPESFLTTLLSYLQLRDAPEMLQQTSRTAGQQIPPVATYRNILAAALEIDGEPENPWYRFQRTGAFLRACFHVAETGRWKFAIDTVTMMADAIMDRDGFVQGVLPENIYGDGSISPSYSAVFAKPADWLRTIWMYRTEPRRLMNVNRGGWVEREDIDFRDEKGNWHANWSTIQVRYIRRAAIESWRWPQSYANAVLAWLEYEEVRFDPKAIAAVAAKQRIYEDMVDKAERSDDRQERPPYNDVGRLVRGRYARIRGLRPPAGADTDTMGPIWTPPVIAPEGPLPTPPPTGGPTAYIYSPQVTYTLPAAPTVDQTITLVDASGTSGTAPIIVSAPAGVLINGLPTFTMQQNYSAFTFIFNGTQWNII